MNILVVDDEKNIRRVMEIIITEMGFKFTGAEDPEKAMEVLEKSPVDILVLDIKMPKMDGISFLKIVQSQYPEIPVIMLSGHGTISGAVESMKIGAADFIEKNGDEEQIRSVLRKTADMVQWRKSADEEDFLFRDSKMVRLVKKADSLSGKKINLLLTGENGVGKEVIAHYIHRKTMGKGAPFIPVNCGALPEGLFESEMFGFEKGAFTGADTKKKGKIRAAEGGTLFLDEIGDLSLKSQVSLLRVLQENQVTPLGSVTPLSVDFNLITATNKDLTLMVMNRKFREDLYFRIAVMELDIPPLRERREDIMPLAVHFLHQVCTKYGMGKKGIHPDLEKFMLHYTWPGNVRELKNFVERLAVLSEGETLYYKETDLKNARMDLNSLLEKNEKEILSRVIRITGGDREKMSRLLNIPVKEVKERLQRHEL